MRRVYIIVGIIGFIILIILVYSFLRDFRCRELQEYGFGYKITGGRSPTWDTVIFFFKSPEGKQVEGPQFTGSCLKVMCRDLDGDNVPEYLVQSQVIEPYQAILQVKPDSGKFHIQYVEGLKVYNP